MATFSWPSSRKGPLPKLRPPPPGTAGLLLSSARKLTWQPSYPLLLSSFSCHGGSGTASISWKGRQRHLLLRTRQCKGEGLTQRLSPFPTFPFPYRQGNRRLSEEGRQEHRGDREENEREKRREEEEKTRKGRKGWRGNKGGKERREGGGRREEGLAQSPEVSTSHCQGQMPPPRTLLASWDPSLLTKTQVGCGAGSSWSSCCLGPNLGSCFEAQLSHHLSGYPNPSLGTTGSQRSRVCSSPFH